MKNGAPNKPEEPREGRLWLNVGKIIFLVAVLVAAWYLLDRLTGGR